MSDDEAPVEENAETQAPEEPGVNAAPEDFEDKYRRALADLDNMRKRTEREFENLRRYSSELLILDVIRSVEDLERAVGDKDDSDNLKKGVGMILEDLKSTLERHGVSEIDVSGGFDPRLHEAVMQECADCAADDGKIAEVLQPGYMLHDRVLRHAKVKVYKYTENEKEVEK